MFCRYAPYTLKDGTWDSAAKDAFAERCFDVVERYAPGFKRSVSARRILSPVDLEETFNVSGGNIFQGSMSLSNLYAFRPVAGFANDKTPVKNRYLCGSAAHPGGGVMGAPGWNAAREMLEN